MNTEELTNMSDNELANTYLKYVILNQQANVEKRLELWSERDQISDTFKALGSEIDRRGKVWQVGFFGQVWLEDKKEQNDSTSLPL